MADLSTPAGSDALDETLGRLSKKAGVKATIVLDRASGAVVKTSGQFSSIRAAKLSSPTQAIAPNGAFSNEASATGPMNESQGAEELAALVWGFIGVAGNLVGELDTEDELRLLRLRTKKQELVIVPDPKYILVVVHDTPPA